VLLLAWVTMTVAHAQAPPFKPSANPVTESVRDVLESRSRHLIQSAELMPPDRYGYRPTPAQMTFGELLAHVVETNIAICSALTSAAPPMGPEELSKVTTVTDKTRLQPLVVQSFEYCAQALNELSDASLAEQAMMFGRPTGMSRAGALVTIAIDWADHYATAAGYLRLNGIVPPSAKPRP
jgi:hypothetical protein